MDIGRYCILVTLAAVIARVGAEHGTHDSPAVLYEKALAIR